MPRQAVCVLEKQKQTAAQFIDQGGSYRPMLRSH
jgi:hypothetical protein